MFKTYREILAIPGALKFAVPGVIARAPVSMVGISLILAVRGIYGSYALAGTLGAVQVIAFALGAPILARLIDRHGQAQVMIPAITVSATCLVLAIIGIINKIDPIYLGLLAAIAGAASGSVGSLVRSRWAYIPHDNPRDLQAAYAMEASFDELVFILGPVAATLLAASVHPAAGLWTAVALQIVGSYAFLFQTSTQPPAVEKKREQRESVMRNPGMIVLTATFVSTGALFGLDGPKRGCFR